MAAQLIQPGDCEMSEPSMPERDLLAAGSAGRPQRKYSAKDRKRLLRRYERSGVSQKQFAREQSVPISTLSYWVRRSRRESEVDAPAAVVEIAPRRLRAASAGKSIDAAVAEGVEIRLPNQLELRVLSGTDAQWVVELLRGLLTCSG
jgi:transposase-like protein